MLNVQVSNLIASGKLTFHARSVAHRVVPNDWVVAARVPRSYEPATPLGPPKGPMHRPTVGSWGGAVSYERGPPVLDVLQVSCLGFGVSGMKRLPARESTLARPARLPTPARLPQFGCEADIRPSSLEWPSFFVSICFGFRDSGFGFEASTRPRVYA